MRIGRGRKKCRRVAHAGVGVVYMMLHLFLNAAHVRGLMWGSTYLHQRATWRGQLFAVTCRLGAVPNVRKECVYGGTWHTIVRAVASE